MSDYKPHIGSNEYVSPGVREDVPYVADIDYLRDSLADLIDETSALESLAEEDLSTYFLKVDEDDSRLKESHAKEWPSALGEVSDRVSYRYYKHLRLKKTTSAAYIRKRYEEAIRDVGGTASIDVLAIASMMKQEALLIQGFLNAYIGNVDDSSEHRTVELFEQWVEAARGYTRQFWTFLQTREQTTERLSQHEIESTTPEEAKQGQAVFKVKLNSYNGDIVKNIEFLKENFAEFAPVFYHKFLGPAINFRLNVGRQVMPTASKLSREVGAASDVLDKNLRTILADQSRRQTLFINKVFNIHGEIKERDKYRIWIRQLAFPGNKIPTSGPKVAEEGDENAAEVEYFDRYERERAAEEEEEESFSPSHDSLTDVENADAHPQYLLRVGGFMEGSIDLADEALVDGMKPGTHAHTGEDGTPKIHGDNIIWGTLPDDAIDTDRRPPDPTRLQVIGHEVVTRPPGGTTINTSIKWDGDPTKYTYEVQYAPVARTTPGGFFGE